jgi:hypothetical protein
MDIFGLDCNKAKWGVNDYAKDGRKKAIDHIWGQHSFHKAPNGKSKFRQNLNTKAQVKNLVDDAVNKKNLVNQLDDGSKSFVKTFDHNIGFDANGKSTNTIIVHTDANGWVKSAYPIGLD